ncbi:MULTISPECIES: ATP-dependent DNA helicase RecG [Hymenobacter]|uniref:ATP-dependent DNA helicase RecG n=1 Tax=Hymenobacter armeniacus TaxID=2771358 RepID=A0ABR8K0F8_9BACT|nr:MULTISPECIES: ATP-dependent DNA helicase RecG [Hymenobacter]MBD2724472.1 ATP-dependent DNA helicase RecG [Hymenobacter armeniacus]MBJ6110555.1 ATP-dependent DNA helicase RecG [Hymenobacter sp. BT523]
MSNFFNTRLEFLRSVGSTQRAQLLGKELGLFTYGDLIQRYPFRYLDRTQVYAIADLHDDLPYVQVKGMLRGKELIGEGPKQRLVAKVGDGTGELEVVWFKGVKWVQQYTKNNQEYIVFGKPTMFNGRPQMAHPELEEVSENKPGQSFLQPVYNTSEKLKNYHRVDSKAIMRMVAELLKLAQSHITESLSPALVQQYGLMPKAQALQQIHFPQSPELLAAAKFRLKFEELFYVQLKLLRQRDQRKVTLAGQIFNQVPTLVDFYKNHLTFDLTGAQKRVIHDIYKDFCAGQQMNRLLQGDVGSGKTIVAFIAMLMAADNGAQSCMMAPTEILADQHYVGLKVYADALGIKLGKLTGSTPTRERRVLHEELRNGTMHMLVGTHALLEDVVQFKNLGLTIMDEQHRFGVAQRSKLWQKNPHVIPHVLVMTATPIPRTLAMTLYGDLDVSVIDELPAGRKPIVTVHRYDANRLKVFEFIRDQVKLGRQIYIVYPLIEESETMDYKDLTDGYESVARAFPEFQISIVHGRMKAEEKDFEMQRFIKRETQIMVATTVIEVGVNVPNASVMVIESAERFGLSQLHQLRGRVGRGADQSYCILMTGFKLSKDARTRLETMVRTNNGFEIADIDLKLRGPGDLMGTQQSGVLDLLIADLSKDGRILSESRAAAQALLAEDPNLVHPDNLNIRRHIESLPATAVNWSRIS